MHSDVKEAVMWPLAKSGTPVLHQDDIDGIRSLYGIWEINVDLTFVVPLNPQLQWLLLWWLWDIITNWILSSRYDCAIADEGTIRVKYYHAQKSKGNNLVSSKSPHTHEEVTQEVTSSLLING